MTSTVGTTQYINDPLTGITTTTTGTGFFWNGSTAASTVPSRVVNTSPSVEAIRRPVFYGPRWASELPATADSLEIFRNQLKRKLGVLRSEIISEVADAVYAEYTKAPAKWKSAHPRDMSIHLTATDGQIQLRNYLIPGVNGRSNFYDPANVSPTVNSMSLSSQEFHVSLRTTAFIQSTQQIERVYTGPTKNIGVLDFLYVEPAGHTLQGYWYTFSESNVNAQMARIKSSLLRELGAGIQADSVWHDEAPATPPPLTPVAKKVEPWQQMSLL